MVGDDEQQLEIFRLRSINAELLKAFDLSPHKLADEAMGREWECGCPFCKMARAAIRGAIGASS